ncbi:DNA methyltransferase [Clostridium sp.]|uniref:DNA methyltransferase n=1 Tax=Clostridium sp. TaxID=1506 RepID=UPI002615F7D6|nr:DNA methyltransferase [Clostridium sp.]
METILKTNNGELIHGDNLEVLKTYEDNTFDNCISDFPYNLAFMGKKWDNQKNFYDWCYQRAEVLYPKIKHGGYVLIFGHHKSNHRMKCAFEDVGFNIVEEIDWVYGSGFPKNQDISKMFDKKDKKVLSEKFKGWKTSGLKPAKEIITVFQKPLKGKYLDNIEKYNCGAMNIDTCRVPISQNDIDIINAKSSKNPTTNYSNKDEKIYGAYEKDMSMPANELGRFPSNIIFDDDMGEILDNQSGVSKSTGGCGEKSMGALGNSIYGKYENNVRATHSGGLGDEGGASRYFLNINFDAEDFVPFMYCPKTTKKEKGEGNIHVTVKPKKLIKWLIKLVTPKDGITLDITSGSGTHGLSCEELNNEEGYNLKWVDIEINNTEQEAYCEIAKNRINTYINNITYK